jgi:hypothetical protein
MIKKTDAFLLKSHSSRRTFMLNLKKTPFSYSYLKGVLLEIFMFLFLVPDAL